MYVFNMYLQCADRFSEVIPEELETAELTVEHLVSQVLLDLFGTVLLEDVSIRLPASGSVQKAQCFVHIYAQCSDFSIPSAQGDLDDVELALENRIGCVLVELFETVNVDKIIISTK